MSQKSRRVRKEAARLQDHNSRRKFFIISGSVLLILSLAGGLMASRNVLLSSLPMLAAAPAPTPTPAPMILAKEYVYAGSKLVATEEIGSSSAPDYATELAVWRLNSGTGTWYVLNGDNTITSQDWGTANDIPAMGDYDGDQKQTLQFSGRQTAPGTSFIAPTPVSTLINGDRVQTILRQQIMTGTAGLTWPSFVRQTIHGRS